MRAKPIKAIIKGMAHYSGAVNKVDGVAFVRDYLQALTDKAIETGERIPLPFNSGYMQVLEHLYPGKDVKHLKEFGNIDYSLIWRLHPLFCYHVVKGIKELNDKAMDGRRRGINYLNDYVDGDFFVCP